MSDNENLFKQNGINVTKQRLLIFQYIKFLKEPFSVNNLKNQFTENSSEENNNIDLVTIYRFVTMLVDKKILRIVGEINGNIFYEMTNLYKPHPHFVCEKCHRIMCLNCLSDSDFNHLTDYAPGYNTKEVNILLGGMCESCK